MPYEGTFTVEVSAVNEYGESLPKSKKLSKLYPFKLGQLLYNILVYSSKVFKLEVEESFDTTNMTVLCCVEDVESLLGNDNCTITIIKEENINQTLQFDGKECVFITIPGAPHQYDNLSYEAYIDDDPDICFRIIIYNGNEISL